MFDCLSMCSAHSPSKHFSPRQSPPNRGTSLLRRLRSVPPIRQSRWSRRMEFPLASSLRRIQFLWREIHPVDSIWVATSQQSYGTPRDLRFRNWELRRLRRRLQSQFHCQIAGLSLVFAEWSRRSRTRWLNINSIQSPTRSMTLCGEISVIGISKRSSRP